jgi:hypothetical protein
MSHQQFNVSDRNPNETTGGGGCICDRRKLTDCKGPFVVFYGNLMEDPKSPHPVLCYACARKAVDRMENEVPLAIGELEGVSGPEELRPTEVRTVTTKPRKPAPKADAAIRI